MSDRERKIVPGRRLLDRINAEKAARLDQWVRLIKVVTPIVLAIIGLLAGIFGHNLVMRNPSW